MATKKVTKTAPVYKAGQYFKGKDSDIHITGKFASAIENDWGEKKTVLVALFNDEVGDIGRGNTVADIVDYQGYDADDEISRINDIEIITKRQHEILAKHPLYTGFFGYNIYVKKGKTPAQDRFNFGCGAVSVTRAEIENLLRIFKSVPPSQLEKVTKLLRTIDNESGQEISDSDIPLIKQILEA